MGLIKRIRTYFRIIKKVKLMTDEQYNSYINARIRDCCNKKVSVEWLKAFKESCDIARAKRGL